MDCNEFELKLSNFIDEDLKQKDVFHFKRHQSNCKACQEKLKLFEITIAKLKSVRKVKVSNDFTLRLHHKISSLKNIKHKSQTGFMGLFNFGLDYKQIIALASSFFIILFGSFYLITVEKIPKVNIVDFQRVNPSLQNNQIELDPQLNSIISTLDTTAKDKLIKNNKVKLDKQLIQRVNNSK